MDTAGYGNIMYSSDGQSWTKTSTGDTISSRVWSVAYGTCNGIPLWVAVGSYGNIMYSSDGQSWTKTSTGDSFGTYGYGVAYGTYNGVMGGCTEPVIIGVSLCLVKMERYGPKLLQGIVSVTTDRAWQQNTSLWPGPKLLSIILCI